MRRELTLFKSKKLKNDLIQLDMCTSLSEESHIGIIRDDYGREYQLGGKTQIVQTDETGMPRVVNVEEGRLLDCGHVVTAIDQVSICGNYHKVCGKHNLYNCMKCGKPMCHMCGWYKRIGYKFCLDHWIWIHFKDLSGW